MELYNYQKKSLSTVLEEISFVKEKIERKHSNLLFQLPTGGGKTVIFSMIAKEYIQKYKEKVIILTHRIELCEQIYNQLSSLDIPLEIINRDSENIENKSNIFCYIAMIESFNNRLQEQKVNLKNISLLIVDEAHHNSFRKIFSYYKNCLILGVTATPLSANINYPLHKTYSKLIIGNTINGLIQEGYLSKPKTYIYNVNTTGLDIGINGDFTASSSYELYSQESMLKKLYVAYNKYGKNKKTIIFNSSIKISKLVYDYLKKHDVNIRSLDSSDSDMTRTEILSWFKNVDNSVLTSVNMFTTGFDVPEIDTIILNRATHSLTLYHQMIGRGSRKTKNKSFFSIVDLGNNVNRFGYWEKDIDWNYVFKNPEQFLKNKYDIDDTDKYIYVLPDKILELYPKTTNIFNVISIKDLNKTYEKDKEKPAKIYNIILQHYLEKIINTAPNIDKGLELLELLEEEIDVFLERYTKTINGTINFKNWLQDKLITSIKRGITLEMDDE